MDGQLFIAQDYAEINYITHKFMNTQSDARNKYILNQIHVHRKTMAELMLKNG